MTEDARVTALKDRRIVVDSRRVAPGDVFVCLRGAHVDGHDYAAEAVRRGAAAVVSERPVSDLPPGVENVVVPNAHAALSSLAAAHFSHPSRGLRCIGITGTNGKTTTTYFVQAVLEAGGVPCAVIGTLGARFGDRTWRLENTTPLALELQELLAEVRAAGARAVAMEVSSHALALHRADDVEFDVAGFTNLTQDHLDFHLSLEAYAASKRALFAELLARSPRQPERVKSAGHAVLNAGDATARAWLAGDASAFPATHTLTYGIVNGIADALREDEQPVDVRATGLELRAEGSRFRLEYAGRSAEVALAPPGRFNVENALCAAGCALALGFDVEVVARGLERVRVVPGRMMPVRPTARGAAVGPLPVVLVDYAHTPDGLANVLDAVRPPANGRLLVVFGAGGERDRAKRPLMGAAAAERADILYVTSDNPRGEDPQAIVDEVMAGVRSAQAAARARAGEVHAELDRAQAIRAAVLAAKADDVVVLAGKGHEDYQIVGTRRLPFDDAAVARAALEEWRR